MVNLFMLPRHLFPSLFLLRILSAGAYICIHSPESIVTLVCYDKKIVEMSHFISPVVIPPFLQVPLFFHPIIFQIFTNLHFIYHNIFINVLVWVQTDSYS